MTEAPGSGGYAGPSASVPPAPQPPVTSGLGDGRPAGSTGSTAATASQPFVASTATAATVGQPLRSGKPKRARLVVRRIDPWSVLKFSLLFSLCLFVVFVVAVAALYFALDALGVFDSVNQFVRDVTQANPGGKATGGFDVTFSAGRIIGSAVVIGLINVVIITAISTLGAFLYNLCADIVGGIEVTLGERE